MKIFYFRHWDFKEKKQVIWLSQAHTIEKAQQNIFSSQPPPDDIRKGEVIFNEKNNMLLAG